MTNPNERPWFQNIDIGAWFQKKYADNGFWERSIDEIVDSVKSIQRKYLSSYKKFFEGIGKAWMYTDKEEKGPVRKYSLTVISLTSFLWFKRIFKIRANAWNMIIHDFDPMTPLFRRPFNRTKNFLKNFPDDARVCKEAVIHWPTCSACQEKFFWRYVKTTSEEERYAKFDDRALYCCNKACVLHEIETDLCVSSIVLPSSQDTKFFTAPFLKAEKRRRKNWQNKRDTLPLPQAWIRFWVAHGFTFPRKSSVYANDTAYEKHMVKNKLPHDDFKYEHLNPYPNG
jgi:hypothetical protein